MKPAATPFLHPDWQSAPANVGALSTLRAGGVSVGPFGDADGQGGLNLGLHVGDEADAVQRNRALLAACLPSPPVWISQVHGTDVVDAAAVRKAGAIVAADASFASEPGVVCVVQTADCLPVLFCDVQGKVVGAAHAGWRGLLGGVLEHTVAAMRGAGAGELLAWLGPAIGPQRFEVGPEVRQAFIAHDAQADAAFLPLAGSPGKYLADIYRLARLRLDKAGGVRSFGGHYCTVTDVARFYSYRRDRTTGRMASMIWLA